MILALGGCGAAKRERPPRVETSPPAVVTKPIIPPIAQPVTKPTVILDSDMTREEALGRNRFPATVLAQMEVVTVRYYSFDGALHQGQIVVHRDLAEEMRAIFSDIEASKEPLAKVIPIVKYGWDDDASMADNNTSGFNYRRVGSSSRGTLSRHASGYAIDINPRQNPYMAKRGGWPYPHRPGTPGTLSRDSAIVRAFRMRGWSWGGNWAGSKDYQHFEKR